MSRFNTTWLAGILGLGCALGAGSAIADTWPSKPITIVVAFAPGGATDLSGRILATELGAALGQTVVVQNKPGAAGQVGTEYVASQPADGYTLLISATGHVMAPSTQTKVNYDPVKSFEPISLLITMPNLLVVNPEVPARNFAEFVDWAKKQSSVPYGSAGAGGATHLSGELLRHLTRLPLAHVAYKGNGPSMADTVAGHINMAFVDTVSVGALVSSGKLRAIAATSAQRSKSYPDVPTIQESGVSGYDLENWVGLYAPAGTPKEIVVKLNGHVNAAMNKPEVRERMLKLGADSTNNLDAAGFRQFVQNETSKWAETIRLTGVTVAN